MRRAFLYGANLQRVFLFAANLQEADVGDANLQGADLHGANLQGASLVMTNLEGAYLDVGTTLPDGTKWTPGTDIAHFTDYKHPGFWSFDA